MVFELLKAKQACTISPLSQHHNPLASARYRDEGQSGVVIRVRVGTCDVEDWRVTNETYVHSEECNIATSHWPCLNDASRS